MARKKPTALAAKTRARYHAAGWVGGNVQTRNKYGSKDFLGFGDELFLKDGVTVAVQVCNASTRAEHLRTILGCPDFPRWCAEKGKVALCSWALRPMGGKRGARKVWVEREEWITPEPVACRCCLEPLPNADHPTYPCGHYGCKRYDGQTTHCRLCRASGKDGFCPCPDGGAGHAGVAHGSMGPFLCMTCERPIQMPSLAP